MFDLLKDLDAEIKKNKLPTALKKPFVATSGFDVLDIMNGTKDPETGEVIAGFSSKIIGFIGKSGSGKTTLAIQVANNLCHDDEGKLIPNAAIFHYDTEGSTEVPRIKVLTRKTQAELDKYYRLMNDNKVNTENLYTIIDMVATKKEEHRDQIMVTVTDRNGAKHEVLPPTVILIDSIAALNTSKENDADDLPGHMNAAHNAKA